MAGPDAPAVPAVPADGLVIPGWAPGWRRVVRGGSVAVLGWSALILVGWAAGIEALKAPIPGTVSVKVNTAISLAALAISSLLAAHSRPPSTRSGRVLRWATDLPAVVALLLGGVTLLELALGVSWPIDNALFPEAPGAVRTATPGQMAPLTALAVVVLAVAFLARDMHGRARRAGRELLLAVAAFTAMSSLLSYAFGAEGRSILPGVTSVAIPTALMILALVLVGWGHRPQEGILHVLGRQGATGQFLRRTLPLILVTPLALGAAVTVGVAAGWWPYPVATATRTVLEVVLFVAIFTIFGAFGQRFEDRAHAIAARAEETLKASNALLDATQRVSKTGGWRLDLPSGRVTWTAETYRIHEVDPATFDPSDVSRDITFYSPEDQARLAAALRRATEAGEPYDLELRLTTAKGNALWVRTVGEPVTVDGKVVRVEGNIADVTHRVRAERALADTNRRLQMVSSVDQALLRIHEEAALLQEVCRIAVNVGGYRFSWVGLAAPDGTVLPLASAGIERGYLAGVGIRWDASELGEGPTGRAIRSREIQVTRDILNAPAMEPWRDAARARGFASSAAVPVAIGDQVAVLHAYASVPDAFDEAELATLRDMAGDIAVGVGAIRERARRETADAAHRASEGRYRLLAENMMDLVVAARPDGPWEYVSPSSSKLLGYSPDELVGITSAQLLHPDDRDRILAERQRIVATGSVAELQLRFRRKDGSYVWIESTSSPARDEQGRIVSLISVLRDVTRRKEAEEALNKLNAELEERVRRRTWDLEAANKELESFAYSVSHDLRAPLRAIDGFSHALLQDYADKLDEDGQDSLRRVRAATQRMGSLIDDVLKLSRVGRAELRDEPVDMSTIATEILTELKTREPERRVEVHVQPGLTTHGDPTLLRLVLQNYLDNAWKFTSKHPTATIEFGVEPTAHGAAYFVRDDGAGFDPAYKEKLFGAFQRLHLATEFPGNGIGLATVRRIVARHHGEAWAEGQVEKGATFYFTLHEKGSS